MTKDQLKRLMDMAGAHIQSQAAKGVKTDVRDANAYLRGTSLFNNWNNPEVELVAVIDKETGA